MSGGKYSKAIVVMLYDDGTMRQHHILDVKLEADQTDGPYRGRQASPVRYSS